MTSPTVLFIAWQEPDSRRILPSARLLRHNGAYEFAYINAVEEATRLGFCPLLAFPDLEGVYITEDLPPLLTNRLMPRTRPDFAGHVGELGLSVEQAEPFAVLARSGGRRETDSLEVFGAPLPCADGYEGFFLARGVRHLPESEATLASQKPGDSCSLWQTCRTKRTRGLYCFAPDRNMWSGISQITLPTRFTMPGPISRQ